MSKLGKKYILSSPTTTQEQRLFDFFNQMNTLQAGVSRFVEEYNNSQNQYEGKVEITGSADSLRQLQDLGINLIGKYENTKFVVDTHYEELIELQGKQFPTVINKVTASAQTMADMVNLYKYNGPLEYNFLVRNYENFLSANPNRKETALPYFYDVLSDFVATDNYEGFVGTQFFETPQAVITSSERNELVTNIIPSEVYVENEPLRIDAYLKKFNVYKEEFPFYTDITFDTHELDEKSVIDALRKKDLYSKLVQKMLDASVENVLNVDSSLASSATQLKVDELDIKDFLYEQLDVLADTDFTFIFDVNQRVDSKARTMLEVFNNEEEYSEVIAYHLKKYQGTTDTLIQEWYLPNLGEGQLNWIDSQIKYDKLYTYKLDLVVLTFATQYEITDFTKVGNRLSMSFVNKPVIKTYILKSITEDAKLTLGSTYTNMLLDYSPMEPELELVPYLGVDNKIKINLNTSTGLKTVPAVNFSDKEDVRKDELRRAQNKDTNSDLLTFQTDEPADFMEIYRTDFKPKSYNDFIANPLIRLSTDNSAGASFIDTIEPNKKYYYTARCIDFHNNISNPTPIYELEILNDNGMIVPFIKLVEFDKEDEKKQLSKAFKRYIKIQPATRHRLTNAEKTDETNIQLGKDQVTPWNRKFKLRLTSKSTGKKIDVNFTFKYNKPE